MALWLIKDTTLDDIANAIREKVNIEGPISILDAPEYIASIPGPPDSEPVSFGVAGEFEEEYEITSARMNEIAAEAQRFARIEELLSPAQIIANLQDTKDDNPFIEGNVQEVHNETATKIKPYCFYGNESLTTIDCPNVETVGAKAFDGCTNLVNINLPKISTVPDYGFSNCKNLIDIAMTFITSIGKYGFYQSGIYEAILPVLENLGENAFAGCESLKKVKINKLKNMSTSAFFNCKGLKEIDLPDCVTINSAENSGTFQGTQIINVNLPNVLTIGASSFQDVISLETLEAPLVTTIGNKTFYGCTTLQEVSLPACTSVGKSAFASSGIKEIKLPVCTSIGDSAFSGSSIEEITLDNFNLPLVTTISTSCFNSCNNLKSIHFSVVTSVGNSAFRYCSALTRCDFDKKVTINYNAFRDCPALETFILRGDEMSTFENWSTDHSFANSGISKGIALIYVPRALLETYTTNSRWKAYINQFRAIEDYPDVCDGKEVVREYVFDTSKESEYIFDKNYVNSDGVYSLRTEYDCEFTEEEIDSGKMISIDIDVNGKASIEEVVIE